MFLKKTYLDKSHIHGIGLFAGEDIQQGEVFYRHSPKLQIILTPEEFESLQEDEKRTFTHYGYFWKDKWYLDCDDIRYLNHSDNPNTGLEKGGIVALKDIQKGEELTQNYKDFEDELRF